jgi:hypothetical protein
MDSLSANDKTALKKALRSMTSFRQGGNEELALLLHGLRSVYVADKEELRQVIVKKLEDELASRGVALADER